MMASTDAELRRELQRFGVNVGPITDTTRNVYTRRLEKLRKDQKTNAAASSSVKTSNSTPNRSTRQTRARGRSKSPILTSTGTRNKRNAGARTNNLGYSTDEDTSEKGAAAKKATSSKSEHAATARSTRQDSRRSFAASREIETRSLTPVHKRVKALTGGRKSASMSPKRRSASLPKPAEKYSDDSDDASERSSTDSWVDMESCETNTTPSLDRRQPVDIDERLRKFKAEIEAWKKEEEKENPSVLSHRNTSSGRRSGVLHNVDQNTVRSDGNRAMRNGLPNLASKILTQAQRPKNPQQDASNSRDGDAAQKRPWTLNFSSFLPIGACIFFVILGLLYATMKYDPALNPVPRIDNYSDEKVENDYNRIANLIYDHVASFAGEKECGTLKADSRLEFSRLRENVGIEDQTKKSFDTACKMLMENDWGVQFYDENDALITESKRLGKIKYVDSDVPMLSGWCRFTRAVQKVLLRIIATTAVGILVWLGLVYRRYRLEKQREEREQMYTMVQKILDVLRRQYDTSENNDNIQPFLPILHVRDMIIPPKDRKKMGKVWERAKHFLSASETRIRVENQTIQGEDYLVWRWIQASSPAKRHTPTSRVWQGEAFDIKSGRMICPTPCLKIRNVFDPAMEVGKNWIEQIQDSILEKCQGNNEILRICVEKDSKEGLVYMLCGSNESAGHAFQALHGAWFDGRLVTVKFIRLHRFHQRFPDSVNQSNTPMRPTSDVPVSTIISTPSGVDTPQYQKLYPTLPDD